MRVTERAHEVVRAVTGPGDLVVDATAGNGHDTVFLAQLVGATGRVLAFDVQEEALDSTRRRLAEAGIEDNRVELLCESHAAMADRVGRPVAAVMFNLGYLPGGDHGCTTSREETVRALGRAWSLLRKEGVLSVVCYRGHRGGAEEAEGVLDFAARLEGAEVTVSGREETEEGPFLVALTKK